MGHSESKNDTYAYHPAKTEDNVYLRSEFRAMDTDADGTLNRKEITRLLMFLGYDGDYDRVEVLFRAINNNRSEHVTMDEYIAVLEHNPDLMKRTSRMRVIFGTFDDNKNGFADKSVIGMRLKQMGYEVNEAMKKKFDDLDENKDGQISYVKFLRNHLEIKGFLS
ncbi:calcium-dependent protein kinase 24-like [Mizuhopecten yessoensis]|uniref:Calcium-binding protein CML15 n=1 Tax=Mizuhopecten yessoensis TaxID=6573 RepID=A0A210PQY8_MIZYE|nr:calcium-dependent protein kinase 24-like [Mizuhopecten yessoensis]OWF38872.1 calcium-binding protein CML15 [Mizuhopecten yessoensis]